MPEQSVSNKVHWEQGGEMRTPLGTVEIHSDEGDVIGYVFPQYADLVQSAPDLLMACEAADSALHKVLTVNGGPMPYDRNVLDALTDARDAIEKARGA